MTHRKEVEALLAEVKVHTGRKAGLVAELCRTWLAVQDAPTGQSLGVVIYHDDERFDNPGHRQRRRGEMSDVREVSAMDRARQYLRGIDAAGYRYDHPITLLAELVAEIEGAASGFVDRMGDDEDGNPRIIIGMTRIEIRDMPNLIGKRVRLLAEGGRDGGG